MRSERQWGRAGWAFTPREKGSYEQRGDNPDARCKGTARIAVLKTPRGRKAGARNSRRELCPYRGTLSEASALWIYSEGGLWAEMFAERQLPLLGHVRARGRSQGTAQRPAESAAHGALSAMCTGRVGALGSTLDTQAPPLCFHIPPRLSQVLSAHLLPRPGTFGPAQGQRNDPILRHMHLGSFASTPTVLIHPFVKMTFTPRS